jgi:hypothetical protein
MSLVYTTGAAPAILSFNSLVSINTTASAAAESAAFTTDTTKNTVEALVRLTIVCPAFTPVAASGINVYAYGSEDGTNYPGALATNEVIDGTDKTLTLSTLGNNLFRLGFIQCHASGGTITSEPMSVASVFGGVLPRKWGIVITNALPAGASLAAAGHAISVTEVSYS